MQEKRPGEASVQYGDARGESAADIADDVVDLNDAAKRMGFAPKGTVVGISMFGSTALVDSVHVTIQVFEGGSLGEIKACANASGGILDVSEFNRKVALVDFVKCFKRLEVSLFTRGAAVSKVRVSEGVEE